MKEVTMDAQRYAQTASQVNNANKKLGSKQTGGAATMDKDSFLKLLVTQLKHQDPTKPMEDREFIAQMAQFTSLEQMKNMNTQMSRLIESNMTSKASSLLGKRIDAQDPATKKYFSGTVESVFFENNQVLLKVGKHKVPMENVSAVHNGAEVKSYQAAAKTK